ncbi:MAG: hypothetical protein QG632_609, partial [Candidatus Dependentiae bacterium]|nr:hypothetical protein [Candidatus Dependentiae bacterium]
TYRNSSEQYRQREQVAGRHKNDCAGRR